MPHAQLHSLRYFKLPSLMSIIQLYGEYLGISLVLFWPPQEMMAVLECGKVKFYDESFQNVSLNNYSYSQLFAKLEMYCCSQR